MDLNVNAVKIALKVIKMFEDCNLIAYPDPASDLYKALSTHNMLAKYMRGDIKWDDLTENFQTLDAKPWTIGYGATGDGIDQHTVWTLEEALEALETRVREDMWHVLDNCPALATEAPERLAACTSLAYNIGLHAFKESTACRLVNEGNHTGVPSAILLWNKAHGLIVDGLDKRRKVEAALYASGGN